jgi:hypothetical protein
MGPGIQTSVVFCSTGAETKTLPLHNEGSFLSGESPWKLSRFQNVFINLYPIFHEALNSFAYLPPPFFTSFFSAVLFLSVFSIELVTLNCWMCKRKRNKFQKKLFIFLLVIPPEVC